MIQIALFGSAARGGLDASSDFDVIAVVDDIRELDIKRLAEELNAYFHREVGLSIYSENRLRVMWNEGSPFAWHLYLQAKSVAGFRSDFLSAWNAPAPYLGARSDCLMMLGVMESVIARLSKPSPGCECYEAGLLYVGARNIGMFASLDKTGKFDFSRYAPFVIRDPFEFPLGRDIYSILVRARHATTRGKELPALERDQVIDWASSIVRWARSITDSLI